MPMLARWPGRIAAGSTSPALLSHLDMPATFARLAGATIPPGQCRDSIDVSAALLGKSPQGRSHFIAHVGGINGPFAVRAGDWKLITSSANTYGKAAGGNAKNPAAPQLYDLARDPAEEKNLAEANPEKVAELRSLLQRERESSNAK